jgi:hypothetical protein
MLLRRLAALGSATALAMALLTASLFVSVPGAGASAANADANEIVRLINGDRVAAGKGALSVDSFLAGKARDGAIPCPDNASRTIAGRTRDFAAYGQMSHYLRLCNASGYKLSSKTFVQTMQSAWGYRSVGEILLVNSGYGNGKVSYTYQGWTTTTYSTTAHAMTGWASSSSHWNIVMGSYDRVGCGAWLVGSSTFYYACEFAKGGGTRTTNPKPPAKTAAPKAAPTATPTATPTASPSPTPTDTPTPTPSPTVEETATPSADPAELADAAAAMREPSGPIDTGAVLVALAALAAAGVGGGALMLHRRGFRLRR